MAVKCTKSKEKGGLPKSAKNMVAPDGGWGWVVVFACALSNFISIPIMQSFALLFQDRFVILNMSATDLAVIINVNSAFGMSLGLVNGPLLKRYGYRKIAIAGAIFYFIGITATSSAGSFIHFLICYSIITSLGLFLLMSSFSLALNTYFRERRGRAVGMTSSFTGLGPVVMPQLITLLMNFYDTQGTTLILAALSFHSLAAAMLLQPVKWHMKKDVVKEKVEVEQGMLEDDKRKYSLVSSNEIGTLKTGVELTTVNSMEFEYDHDVDSHSMYGYETPLVSHRHFGSTHQIPTKANRKISTISFRRSISQYDNDAVPAVQNKKSHLWWESEETVNLGSSYKIFDEKPYYPLKQFPEEAENIEEKLNNNSVSQSMTQIAVADGGNNNSISHNKDYQSKENLPNDTKKNICAYIMHSIVTFFDLDLLRDPGYVILMLGMSLAICAEMNFSLFTPLILGDFNYTKSQIATIMSVIGIGDIIFRFLAPFIGEWLKYSAQGMYLLSLLMLISSRTLLLFFNDYEIGIGVAVLLGIAKGFRTVYMALVIPAYVPLERLASASGLQMVTNSLFVVASIPIMASVRDATGSYAMSIIAINCITALTVLMWSIQLLWIKYKTKRNITEL